MPIIIYNYCEKDSMRKYDALKLIFETAGGISPKELAQKMNASLPNIYGYLSGLVSEDLVRKTPEGKYFVDDSGEKPTLILDLMAMSPEKFHLFISPDFRKLIAKLCAQAKSGKGVFSNSEVVRIERVAIPARVVLRLSKRPSSYCLKINEAHVAAILKYHNLKAKFTPDEFNNLISRANVRKRPSNAGNGESEPKVIEMCDNLHENGGDMSVLENFRGFAPDQRIASLLKTAEQANKEYRLFLGALDETTRGAILGQWGKHYIYNTNKIEGNTMSQKDVDNYLKNGKEPEHISKREIFETSNMRNALDFLNLKKNAAMGEELISDLHFMVQKDITDEPGRYKKFYNYIRPSSATTPPRHVRERMRLLLEWHKENSGKAHPFVLASVFHMQFEAIHPFPDGNGRVGRLAMNHILQQNNYMPITILERTKQNYYRALENRSIPQFLEYALTLFIEEHKR